MNDLGAIGRPRLVERIRDLIQRGGPLTFDRFMELALYGPSLGYYSSLTTALDGRSGALADFQTSPQVQPLFGDLVARELSRIWETLGEPRPFVLLELGAGAGELARQILDGLAERIAGVEVVYHAVEVRWGAGYDPHLNPLPEGEGNRQPLPEGEGITRWTDLATLAASGSRVHAVLSNEFFDALPVHRLLRVEGELKEAYVDWGGHGFVERSGDLSDLALGRLVEHRAGAWREGWRGEVCSRIGDVLETVAGTIDRGVVLTIDYGYEVDDPNYPVGETLLAYHRHQWSDELLLRVGEQDLTSHLDVEGFLRVGSAIGLVPAGVTSQRDFLRSLGFAAESDRWSARETTPGRQWQARFAMAELVDPRGLGQLKVVAQAKGDVPYVVASAEST